jgi:hypothetical protein
LLPDRWRSRGWWCAAGRMPGCDGLPGGCHRKSMRNVWRRQPALLRNRKRGHVLNRCLGLHGSQRRNGDGGHVRDLRWRRATLLSNRRPRRRRRRTAGRLPGYDGLSDFHRRKSVRNLWSSWTTLLRDGEQRYLHSGAGLDVHRPDERDRNAGHLFGAGDVRCGRSRRPGRRVRPIPGRLVQNRGRPRAPPNIDSPQTDAPAGRPRAEADDEVRRHLGRAAAGAVLLGGSRGVRVYILHGQLRESSEGGGERERGAAGASSRVIAYVICKPEPRPNRPRSPLPRHHAHRRRQPLLI